MSGSEAVRMAAVTVVGLAVGTIPTWQRIRYRAVVGISDRYVTGMGDWDGCGWVRHCD